MIQVKVNDTNLNVPAQGLSTLGELVEYVKSSIDPDSIIVSLTKNDEPISDMDWRNPITQQSDVILSFTTGSKITFVDERLLLADEIINTFVSKLEMCAQAFKQLRIHSANTEFGTFLKDLSAFVSWFDSILAMDTHRFSQTRHEYSKIVEELEKVCLIVQNQQLTSSWWALSEALTNKMLPMMQSILNLITTARKSNPN